MISVIIPNKGESNLDEVIRQIKRVLPCEIIISDGTLGKGAALKNGSQQAKGDFIVWLDGDLQIHPREILTFTRIMTMYDADAVVGNKRHSFSITHYSLIRRIVSQSYNFLVRALFGFNLRDTQCGLKLFKAEALKAILPDVVSKGFAFDLEVLVALHRRNYRIADAPVLILPQANAGSVSLGTILKTFWETMRIWRKRKNNDKF